MPSFNPLFWGKKKNSQLYGRITQTQHLWPILSLDSLVSDFLPCYLLLLLFLPCPHLHIGPIFPLNLLRAGCWLPEPHSPLQVLGVDLLTRSCTVQLCSLTSKTTPSSCLTPASICPHVSMFLSVPGPILPVFWSPDLFFPLCFNVPCSMLVP